MTTRASGGWVPRRLRTKRCTLWWLLAKPYSETKSCQMARALRPRLSPNSMASWYGSQALARGLGCGDAACPCPVSGARAPTSSRGDGLRSVITWLAGLEVAFAFPLLERFSGLGLGLGLGESGITGIAGFAAPESVITSLAGFGARRPQALGGRTAIPAAFRYALAVSRRIRVACWIRRSDHPSRPSAKTCCFFSSFKTLAMPTEPTSLRGNQCPGRRFHWPVLGDRRSEEHTSELQS